jgi:hypothetical protein
MFPLDQYVTGFDLMITRPRASAKIVLFPDPAELEAAKQRRKL